MRHSPRSTLAAILILGMLPLSSTVAAAAGQTSCELTYSLKGWSAFYKTASGQGVISCDNGQSMAVAIHVEGGGITFGKTEVKNAKGKFTEVAKIDDLLGAYAAAEAEAGAVKSGEAQALTKGEVSLALAGTGSGWSLGVSGAKFKITRKNQKK
jgi:hypothetical protein